ncbi:MAG: amino acid adenylation protein, partial [Gallionellaceae bacterium]
SGQNDICIGTAIANRNLAEIEPLIGFFANTLVLRNRVSGEVPFIELLQQVRTTTLDAYAHQDMPFEQLVDALMPERNLGHQPLFQVMLVLHNMQNTTIHLPGLDMQQITADAAIAKCDLLLNIRERAGQLQCNLEYNTDLFDTTSIERMTCHLTNLLNAAVSLPTCRAGDMTLIDYPSDQTIQQLFEAQAVATPNSIAAVFENDRLTYTELNAKSNQLAHHLRSVGVGPDSLVGICVERSLQMMIGLLGILKAGGAYVPLDPDYPVDRRAYMLSDALPVLLLTQQHLFDASTTDHHTLPGHLAYVIYTSGSTGKPKGVQVTQGGLVNLMKTMQQRPGIEAEDVLLSVTSLSFDLVVPDLFLPLISGACAVFVTRQTATDPTQLVAVIECMGVTFMQATPSTWGMLLNHGWPRQSPPL